MRRKSDRSSKVLNSIGGLEDVKANFTAKFGLEEEAQSSQDVEPAAAAPNPLAIDASQLSADIEKSLKNNVERVPPKEPILVDRRRRSRNSLESKVAATTSSSNANKWKSSRTPNPKIAIEKTPSQDRRAKEAVYRKMSIDDGDESIIKFNKDAFLKSPVLIGTPTTAGGSADSVFDLPGDGSAKRPASRKSGALKRRSQPTPTTSRCKTLIASAKKASRPNSMGFDPKSSSAATSSADREAVAVIADDRTPLPATARKSVSAPAVAESSEKQNRIHIDPTCLEDVVAYVEVYMPDSGGSTLYDKSWTFRDHLQRMGATIKRRHCAQVTHVVFQGGRPELYKKLRAAQHVQLVNIQWVYSCWSQQRLVPVTDDLKAEPPVDFSDSEAEKEYDLFASPKKKLTIKRLKQPTPYNDDRPSTTRKRSVRRGTTASSSKPKAARHGSPVQQRLIFPAVSSASSSAEPSPVMGASQPSSSRHKPNGINNSTRRLPVPVDVDFDAEDNSEDECNTPLMDRVHRRIAIQARAQHKRRTTILERTEQSESSTSQNNSNSMLNDSTAHLIDDLLNVDINAASPAGQQPVKKPESGRKILSTKAAGHALLESSFDSDGPATTNEGGTTDRQQRVNQMDARVLRRWFDEEGYPEQHNARTTKTGEPAAGKSARRHTVAVPTTGGSTNRNNRKTPRTAVQATANGTPGSGDFVLTPRLPRRNSALRTNNIVLSNCATSDREACASVCKRLGGAYRLAGCVNEHTTHVVVEHCDKRTLSCLHAMARGLWLVSIQWVYKSLEQGAWLPEEPFECTDRWPGAKARRVQRQVSGNGVARALIPPSLPALFVTPDSRPPTVDVVNLIRAIGGKIAPTVKRAGLIVGNAERIQNAQQLPLIKETWILDSISLDELQDYNEYL